MNLKYIFSLAIIFMFFEVLGQRYLLMDKIGGRQRREFYPGNELKFKLKGEDHFNTAQIIHLQDSLIIFYEGVINVKDIKTIKTPRRTSSILGVSRTAKIRIAGIGLIIIDQINTIVVAGEPFSISSGVFIVGGSLVAFSYIIDLSQKNKFKIRRNRRLRIIDVGFG
ncbi:MAG: hypothetical protein M3421_11035 [Bacteroidota bacterium]|nr:hypothetical protein [Bacteroidota bacterium]